jgi:hypothetical protein
MTTPHSASAERRAGRRESGSRQQTAAIDWALLMYGGQSKIFQETGAPEYQRRMGRTYSYPETGGVVGIVKTAFLTTIRALSSSVSRRRNCASGSYSFLAKYRHCPPGRYCKTIGSEVSNLMLIKNACAAFWSLIRLSKSKNAMKSKRSGDLSNAALINLSLIEFHTANPFPPPLASKQTVRAQGGAVRGHLAPQPTARADEGRT